MAYFFRRESKPEDPWIFSLIDYPLIPTSKGIPNKNSSHVTVTENSNTLLILEDSVIELLFG